MKSCLPAFLLFATASSAFTDPVVVGSKKFTESYVLAEIARHAIEDAGVAVEHRQGMGGTIILWEALRTGQISALSGIYRHHRRGDSQATADFFDRRSPR